VIPFFEWALVITPPVGLGAQSAQHLRDTVRAVSRGGGLGGFMIEARGTRCREG
jgi:hypothetical protein